LEEIESSEDELAESDGGMEGALAQLIDVLQEKLMDGESAFSIGDLLRLLHIRKGLTGTQRNRVEMRWVTEWDESPDEE
jgi:hypothetical protein